MGPLFVFSGNANKPLAKSIAKGLSIELGNALVSNFSDRETRIEINANVRGGDVFVIQSTSSPANEHLMELLIMIDALKRASASRITAVIPYFGYARQERKVASRSPITAKLVADMLSVAGVHRVISMDLHAGAIQGFFDVPFDHMIVRPVFINYLKSLSNAMIVSPDAGGVERCRSVAKRLGLEIAIVDKRRDAPNKAKVYNVVGNVKGKDCVLYDDIVDTAGTLSEAAQALKDNGAASVIAMCTHGVLSGTALDRISKSVLTKLVVTDTIKVAPHPKIEVVSVGQLLSETIRRIHNSESVSNLFD